MSNTIAKVAWAIILFLFCVVLAFLFAGIVNTVLSAFNIEPIFTKLIAAAVVGLIFPVITYSLAPKTSKESMHVAYCISAMVILFILMLRSVLFGTKLTALICVLMFTTLAIAYWYTRKTK